MWLNLGYAAAGVVALLMFKSSPPRAPKVATLLAMVAGFGVAGWLGGLIGTGLDLIGNVGTQFVGVSVVSILFLVALYLTVNQLLPKMGKVAGGTAGFGTAIWAFLLPTLALASGGTIAAFYLDIAGSAGQAVASFADQGL